MLATVVHAKPGPEVAWAERQGLPRIVDQSEQWFQVGGVQADRVHLVHKGGAETDLIRLANGQIVGPLQSTELITVTDGKAPLVGVRPVGPDARILLVDLGTGGLTPTATAEVTVVSRRMVVLTAPEAWDRRDAVVLGVPGLVWHARDVLPGDAVVFEQSLSPTALVATREGLRLFDDEGKALLSLPEVCPAPFIRVGEESRVAN